MLALLLALGFWQLDRARQKEALAAAFAAYARLPAVPVSTLDPAAAARYRRVTAMGRYDLDHQILLDNQVQDGRPGYHVLTPLRLPDVPWAILVNRGWVPAGESRDRLPEIVLADADVVISGRLGQPANPGLRLGQASGGWPRLVQHVDYAALAADLGYPLAPAVILLDPGAAGGPVREWQVHAAGFGPQRHRGYAVQWFALAATLLVIYVAVNTRRVAA